MRGGRRGDQGGEKRRRIDFRRCGRAEEGMMFHWKKHSSQWTDGGKLTGLSG